MSRKVLYLLTKPTVDSLLEAAPSSQESSVVLLHEAVHLQKVPAKRVYVLQNSREEKSSSSFDVVSYKDLINLIFESDQVVAL